MPEKTRITENDIKVIRQRLIALDEGRTEDAGALCVFLTGVRGLHLNDFFRSQGKPDWIEHWRIPEGAERLTILMDYGFEPVWALPVRPVAEPLVASAKATGADIGSAAPPPMGV